MNKKKKRLLFWGVTFIALAICFFKSFEQSKIREEVENFTVCFFACSDDADSILLKNKEHSILIDTGLEEDASEMVRKMKKLGVKDLDLVVLTHPDKDHIGGMVTVLKNFPVKQIIQSPLQRDTEEQNIMNEWISLHQMDQITTALSKKTKLQVGDLKVTLFPAHKAEYENHNNYSLAVLVEYNGQKMFFPGDAKKERIKELLDENLPQVTLYKVSYHGRDVKGEEELLSILKPNIAVVTAREAEEKTKELLKTSDAKVYTTYEHDVCFTMKKNGKCRLLDDKFIK